MQEIQRTWVIFSRLALGFRGASVSSTGCSCVRKGSCPVLIARWDAGSVVPAQKPNAASSHLRSHAQLVEESVVPDLLHVVPVGHDTVLNGVAQSQDTALGLSLVTDVGVLSSGNFSLLHSILTIVGGLRHAAQQTRTFWPMPTITPVWRGRPTMLGKTARGASSPAKPACEGAKL